VYKRGTSTILDPVESLKSKSTSNVNPVGSKLKSTHKKEYTLLPLRHPKLLKVIGPAGVITGGPGVTVPKVNSILNTSQVTVSKSSALISFSNVALPILSLNAKLKFSADGASTPQQLNDGAGCKYSLITFKTVISAAVSKV